MREDRELIAAFGKIAHDYDYDTVISAAANIMLNALRQKHLLRSKAGEQFEEVVFEMREELRTRHYNEDGSRNDRRIVIPSPRELLRSLQ